MKRKKQTQNAMKILGGIMFFMNGTAFIFMMLIYGRESMDFFWGPVGHFIYVGGVIVADILMSAIIYILPQNWSQQD